MFILMVLGAPYHIQLHTLSLNQWSSLGRWEVDKDKWEEAAWGTRLSLLNSASLITAKLRSMEHEEAVCSTTSHSITGAGESKTMSVIIGHAPDVNTFLERYLPMLKTKGYVARKYAEALALGTKLTERVAMSSAVQQLALLSRVDRLYVVVSSALELPGRVRSILDW